MLKKLEELRSLRARHPKLAPGQGVLDFDDDEPRLESEPQPEHVDEAPDGETPEDSIRQRHKPKEAARKLDTSQLPVEHVYHELTPEERLCPTTGKTLVAVGEALEEEVELQPGYVKLVVHHRTVYGLSEEDARERQADPMTAPGPPRPIEGSIAGPGLVAWILVQKYGRHLPLYRQESILAQHGLRIPRQTSCDWVLQAAHQLGPIQEALRRSIQSAKVVQTDDTPVKCQLDKGKGNMLAHLWTTVSPLVDGVLYDFSQSRGHEHLFTILPDLEEGVLIGDGYAGYDTFAGARRDIVVAGCWAHSLRKFRDALNEAPILAVEAMTLIGKLFDIEKRATEEELTLERRGELRRTESASVLDELEELLRDWRAVYSESGVMGTACKYVENQRAPLRVFLADPRVPIHNNACEVAIRPVAVGRRSSLAAPVAAGRQRRSTRSSSPARRPESIPRRTWPTSSCALPSIRPRAWTSYYRRTGSGSPRPLPELAASGRQAAFAGRRRTLTFLARESALSCRGQGSCCIASPRCARSDHFARLSA